MAGKRKNKKGKKDGKKGKGQDPCARPSVVWKAGAGLDYVLGAGNFNRAAISSLQAHFKVSPTALQVLGQFRDDEPLVLYAAELGVADSTLQGAVKSLVEKGLLDLGPKLGKAQSYSITEKGISVHVEGQTLFDTALEAAAAVGEFDQFDVKMGEFFLRRLTDALSQPLPE